MHTVMCILYFHIYIELTPTAGLRQVLWGEEGKVTKNKNIQTQTYQKTVYNKYFKILCIQWCKYYNIFRATKIHQILFILNFILLILIL